MSPTMPPSSTVAVPASAAFPAAMAAGTMACAHVAGLSTPLNTAASRVMATASVSPSLHLLPDVQPSVVHHRLGHRHDGRDLLGLQHHVGPGLLGGLLQTGVPLHEVGHGQRAEHRQLGDLGAHGNAAEQLKRGALCAAAALTTSATTSSGISADASAREMMLSNGMAVLLMKRMGEGRSRGPCGW